MIDSIDSDEARDFVGVLTHDLNNLLGVILGNAELTGRDLGDDSPERELVGQIVLAARRACDLTDKLSAYFEQPPPGPLDMASADEIQPQPLRPGDGRVAMVVDDDLGIRRLVRIVFQRAGFTVIEANDGHSAVQQYTGRGDVGLVLLDLNMPGSSGESTCHELLKIDPLITIIIMSGLSEDEARQRIDGCSVAGFIRKPFEIEQLERVAVHALG